MSFYIILPSNACPLTQPDNAPSKFIIDWESELVLGDAWEVALVEYSFIYDLKEVPIIYSTFKKNIIIPLDLTIKNGLMNHIARDERVKVFVTKENKLQINVEAVPCTIRFASIDQARVFGFKEVSKTFSTKTLLSDDIVNYSIDSVETSELDYPESRSETRLMGYKNFSTKKELENYFSGLQEIFEEFRIDENSLVSFKINSNLVSIKFSQYLQKTLGYGNKNVFYYVEDYNYVASSKPFLLKNTFDQLYIYSNLTQPILVGGVYIPLLQSIWVNPNETKNEFIHDNIKKPMYIKTSLTRINNVEIEIRNDSGQIINFPYGSKSSLTLHFRRNDE